MGKGMPAATANSWVLNGHNIRTCMKLFSNSEVSPTEMNRLYRCICQKMQETSKLPFGWGKWMKVMFNPWDSPIFRQTQTGGSGGTVPQFPSRWLRKGPEPMGCLKTIERWSHWCVLRRESSGSITSNPSNPNPSIPYVKGTSKWLSTTGWWFGSFFIFPNSWDDDPIWLICFRG